MPCTNRLGMVHRMSEPEKQPKKKLTLSEDDIQLVRRVPSSASLGHVGGGAGSAGKHVGGDPDAGPVPWVRGHRPPAGGDADAS